MKREALLEFSGSHHYDKTFEKSDYFCPRCGKKELWICQDGGDYYVGETYYCLACDGQSYLDGVGPVRDKAYLRLIDQIRKGVKSTPTTPRGN